MSGPTVDIHKVPFANVNGQSINVLIIIRVSVIMAEVICVSGDLQNAVLAIF